MLDRIYDSWLRSYKSKLKPKEFLARLNIVGGRVTARSDNQSSKEISGEHIPLKPQENSTESKTSEKKEPDKGALKVAVVNKCDGEPIKDASVHAANQKKPTNSQGEAVFSDLTVNSYKVEVKKEFPEAYYQVQSNFDWLLTDKVGKPKKAESKQDVSNVKVEKNKTAEAEAEIAVWRLVDKIVFKRINPKASGNPGHWWVEIDGKESYGWYPAPYNKSPPTSPKEPSYIKPPEPHNFQDGYHYLNVEAHNLTEKVNHGFAIIEYEINQALYSLKKALYTAEKFFPGVKGSLNEGEIEDPHYGDEQVDSEYQPVVNGEEKGKKCWKDEEFKAYLRNFAKKYTGKYSILPFRQCHTFQLELIRHCSLDKLKTLK